MKRFKTNTELVQGLFDVLREILKLTLKARELISKDELELLPETIAQRDEKIKELELISAEVERKKHLIPNFEKIRNEVILLRDEILKIDKENADNIREKAQAVSEELRELLERKKLLNYLR